MFLVFTFTGIIVIIDKYGYLKMVKYKTVRSVTYAGMESCNTWTGAGAC